MTISTYQPNSRPVGQRVITILLFVNAAICIFFSIGLYLAEQTGYLRYDVLIAILTSISPPLALTCIVSPILTWRRSALGLILAGAVVVALVIDFLLCFLSFPNFPPLLLKVILDLCILIVIAIFLVRRATYSHLNPDSYGFPVIARTFGAAPAAALLQQIPQTISPSEDAPMQPTSAPQASSAAAGFQYDPRIAASIKEAHAQSYIRTANYLRIMAIIFRIVAIVLIFIDVVLVFWQLYARLSPFYSGFPRGTMGSSPEFSYYLASTLTASLTGLGILTLLLFSTFLLTALAELLRCQAVKPN